jgi:MoaA/NifB/PqqE/SkfB family radical SAM enzyme
VGRRCPLKTIPVDNTDTVPTTLRYLMIEPTTACDLRCLSCPVRDIAGDVTWSDAWPDGGLGFALWDGARRAKQHTADRVRRLLPMFGLSEEATRQPITSQLLRGRMRRDRGGTLPIDVVKRVISDAGSDLARIDLFNYGEPFLYRPLVEALKHIRAVAPTTDIAISTDGLQVRPEIQSTLIEERLLDWIIFSVDGIDQETYGRYRIRGSFERAFRTMVRFNEDARDSGIRVIWQYVVFRWNDADAHLRRAMAMAEAAGLRLQFDFAHTWGRSRRRPDELQYVRDHLRPFTALPGESRRDGW